MPTVRVFNLRLKVPASRTARAVLGGGLLAGGLLGFLPILGFWMIPAGALILSVDSPIVRRWNRRATVRLARAWHSFRTKREPAAGGEASD